jgi:hypothetical protein
LLSKRMPQKTMAVMITSILATGAIALVAATQSIGIVSSGPGQASVAIDGARVSGNATLFDGSVVTAFGYSRLQLNSGTRMDLGNGSSVRVFANHASLEGGSSEVQSTSGYSIDARSLRIQPEGASIARVKLDGDQKVLVTALAAPVKVWNSQGILVARVMPEMPLSFLPQAADGTKFSSSGCVVNKSGAAFFVDQTGNQVYELRSSAKAADLRNFVGKRAMVTGSVDGSAKAAPGAAQVVSVNAIEVASGASCADAGSVTAKGAVAGAAAPAGVAAAVIVGVVVAAGVAVGTAIAVNNSNSSP